jgi:hypothetical protein
LRRGNKSLSLGGEKEMKIRDICDLSVYTFKSERAILGSTGELITDLLCPYCDGEIEIDTILPDEFAKDTSFDLVYYCQSCNECFRDTLLKTTES